MAVVPFFPGFPANRPAWEYSTNSGVAWTANPAANVVHTPSGAGTHRWRTTFTIPANPPLGGEFGVQITGDIFEGGVATSFGQFFYDGVLLTSSTGLSAAGVRVPVPVTAGVHTFEWREGVTIAGNTAPVFIADYGTVTELGVLANASKCGDCDCVGSIKRCYAPAIPQPTWVGTPNGSAVQRLDIPNTWYMGGGTAAVGATVSQLITPDVGKACTVSYRIARAGAGTGLVGVRCDVLNGAVVIATRTDTTIVAHPGASATLTVAFTSPGPVTVRFTDTNTDGFNTDTIARDLLVSYNANLRPCVGKLCKCVVADETPNGAAAAPAVFQRDLGATGRTAPAADTFSWTNFAGSGVDVTIAATAGTLTGTATSLSIDPNAILRRPITITFSQPVYLRGFNVSDVDINTETFNTWSTPAVGVQAPLVMGTCAPFNFTLPQVMPCVSSPVPAGAGDIYFGYARITALTFVESAQNAGIGTFLNSLGFSMFNSFNCTRYTDSETGAFVPNSQLVDC